MKKTLLFIFVIVSHFFGKCQSYNSLFGQDSTTWTIVKEIIDGAETYRYQTITNFDSTLNGHNYKKVFDGYYSIGLIREDTLSGKVWYYSFNSQTEWTIMNLSLQLNDTFMIHTSWLDTISVVVDSVYFMSGLKHIRFDYSNFSQLSKFEFIEGTGPNAGITYQGETQGWSYVSEQLLCKYTDTTQVYSNIDYNGLCYVTLTGINKFSNEAPCVAFPNPTTSKLTIESATTATSFELRDIAGKLLMHEAINTKRFEIDLSNYSSGIYFLTVAEKDKQAHRKVIRE